jgi:Acetyltransferases
MNIITTTDAALLAKLNEPIQSLHCQLYPDEFMPFDEAAVRSYFESHIANYAFVHFLATDADIVMGFAQLEIQERKANAFKKPSRKIHVHQLVVLPQHRRKGIATALMNKVHEYGAEQGITQIDLTVWDRNTEAIEFYKSLGYKPDLIRLYR